MWPTVWSLWRERPSLALPLETPARALSLLIAALLACWLLASLLAWRRRRGGLAPPPALRRAFRLLLVTAHPDDEALFFAPALRALAAAPGCRAAALLCCSRGDFAGLGAARSAELVAACAALGLRAERVAVLDHPLLQDGQRAPWEPALVAAHVRAAVERLAAEPAPPPAPGAGAGAGEAAAAAPAVLVVTFDARGASGHRDHTAVYRGVCAFDREARDAAAAAAAAAGAPRRGEAAAAAAAAAPAVVCYALRSAPYARKFCGALDVATSEALHWLRLRRRRQRRRRGGAGDGDGGEGGEGGEGAAAGEGAAWPGELLLFGAGPRLVWRAMRAHASQLTWWRALLVCSTRYAFVNALRRIGDRAGDAEDVEEDERAAAGAVAGAGKDA
jgi:N-acetylglucosaminylphosphatidylinositol deacetylase